MLSWKLQHCPPAQNRLLLNESLTQSLSEAGSPNSLLGLKLKARGISKGITNNLK